MRKHIICFFFLTISILNVFDYAYANDNSRWITVFENFRYIRAVDLNTVEKSKMSRRIRCWVKLTDKGDDVAHKILNRYEIDYDNKKYRITDSAVLNNKGEITNETYNENSPWYDVYPDDYVEKIVIVISNRYRVPLLFKTRVHNWQIAFKDERCIYSICKDYYELNEDMLKFYYRTREKDGRVLTNFMIINIRDKEVYNQYNGKCKPIIPGTFEEAAYNEMEEVIR